MNLVIFDIDGTLTHTNAVDSRSFINALQETLNITATDINTDWTQYRYSTDSGILDEIYQYLFKRFPGEQEVNQIRECFVNHLQQAWAENNAAFSPIVGAETIFKEIENLKDWHIGIATGTWKLSALFKLKSASIPHADLPKAYADDHIERAEIINITMQHAKKLYAVDQYKRIIYVGDRDWDQRAAKQLKIEFIGVGSTFSDIAGINLQIPDYSDPNLLLRYLDS